MDGPARQGHRYKLIRGGEVLALQSGEGLIRVARIDENQPYPLGAALIRHTWHLTPLPMRYFNGNIPA